MHIWTASQQKSPFMGEMTFPCFPFRNMSSKSRANRPSAGEDTSAVYAHTAALCLRAWRSGGFGFTHAHFRLLKLDPLTPKRLGALKQVTSATRFFGSTICHFTRRIGRLRAWTRRAPVSLGRQFIKISPYQQQTVGFVSSWRVRPLTDHLQVCSCARWA